MISAELRLLVILGWDSRSRRKPVFVTSDEEGAARRLLRNGLISPVGSLRVILTDKGEGVLRLLDETLRKEAPQ